MINTAINTYLHKLIDWKEFELLVADIYKESDEVTTEHNVTEYGKSGSKYQIDVRVIQKIKLHEIKILIECKQWKAKVDRQVINVMAAAIEDLNANKGVIFTTVGYEKGAIQYAKSKNIDIFIIRDVKDDEWGKPGRFIWFYLQTFNGKITDINAEGVRFISTTGRQPKELNLVFPFTKEAENDEKFQLYSFPDLKQGDKLIRLLGGIRNQILKNWMNRFQSLLQPESETQEIAFESQVTIDFKDYPFHYLKTEDGYIKFDIIQFTFLQCVSQAKINHDRAETSQFILIVENYITEQKNFLSKWSDDNNVTLSEPIMEQGSIKENIMENGSTAKVMMDFYVNFELAAGTLIKKTPHITVNIVTPNKSI